MKLLICFLVALMLLIFLSSKCSGRKDNYTGSDCVVYDPNYPDRNYTFPQPPAPVTSRKDCDAWLNYLSTGILNIPGRSDKAMDLIGRPDIWNICSMDQIQNIYANVTAYAGAETGLGPFDIGVNSMVHIIESDPKYTKDNLCRIAKVITTVPINSCQAADYTNNYMARITSDTKNTLNQWLSDCN